MNAKLRFKDLASRITGISIPVFRQRLTEAIQELPDSSNAVARLRGMRAACREYLDSTQRSWSSHWTFLMALGRSRSLFGVNVAYLAVEYGVDVEGELASIVPPEFTTEDPGPEQIDGEGLGSVDARPNPSSSRSQEKGSDC